VILVRSVFLGEGSCSSPPPARGHFPLLPPPTVSLRVRHLFLFWRGRDSSSSHLPLSCRPSLFLCGKLRSFWKGTRRSLSGFLREVFPFNRVFLIPPDRGGETQMESIIPFFRSDPHSAHGLTEAVSLFRQEVSLGRSVRLSTGGVVPCPLFPSLLSPPSKEGFFPLWPYDFSW